jgi:hypothetical protein
MVEQIIAIDPMLSSLAQGRLLSLDDKKLSIAFDREFAAGEVRDRLPRLRDVLKQLWSRDVAVEVVVGALPPAASLPGTETLIEVEQRKLDDDREQRRQEALGHPARKLIDQKFSGATWRDPVVDLDKE